MRAKAPYGQYKSRTYIGVSFVRAADEGSYVYKVKRGDWVLSRWKGDGNSISVWELYSPTNERSEHHTMKGAAIHIIDEEKRLKLAQSIIVEEA